jgi:hypothetical protein
MAISEQPNWAGLLAHDLRYVFNDNYKDMPRLMMMDFKRIPPESRWKRYMRTFKGWFSEYRGVVKR